MIELNNVTKYFKTDGEKKYVLKNVTFTIPSGVNVGILGRNGAGKSTLLRMLGGIDFPTVGTITSDKTFSWPMGLAGGFQGSMTGRQNVKFVCRVYGKTDAEIMQIIQNVQEFAEIGDYFDMPIKSYSSGMRSRLSFGLSLSFDFDYLIIDETLSVGDENFKKKAKNALMKKIENCNVLLVSHSMGDLRKICDAGILIDDGKIFYYEDIEDAIKAYHNVNATKVAGANNAPASSAIYCSDGKVFDNINLAANFYKVRPMSIVQALNENNGSNVYLKKVFWRDGQNKLPYQTWYNTIKNETIISSDGVIFEDTTEAALFYMERFPKANIDKNYVEKILKKENKMTKIINVEFFYLSEFE